MYNKILSMSMQFQIFSNVPAKDNVAVDLISKLNCQFACDIKFFRRNFFVWYIILIIYVHLMVSSAFADNDALTNEKLTCLNSTIALKLWYLFPHTDIPILKY